MKKLLLVIAAAFVLSTSMSAKELLTFTVRYEDNKPIGNGGGKSPMRPPVVYIDNHTLSFVVGHPDYILTIKDDDGDVVYTTTVFSAQTEVILPSTLFGYYEILFTMGYRVGYDVYSYPYGDVIVKPGRTLKFVTNNDVYIKNGFECEKGALLEIK